MFTGIIQTVAPVLKAQPQNGGLVLTIARPARSVIKPGDSIAVNGVCLTATAVTSRSFQVTLVEETLERSTFGSAVLEKVNLERPLRPMDFLNGHIVQGHVDAVGKITKIQARDSSHVYTIQFPKKFSALVVEKGSVAVDGISLTIVAAGKDYFSVALIPYTHQETTLGEKEEGDLVNLEFDIIAKYIKR